MRGKLEGDKIREEAAASGAVLGSGAAAGALDCVSWAVSNMH